MKREKEYGLFTAITMIVGIVIGAGIFFKSDNILVYTGGSVIKGVMLFCLAAMGIVFGSLTIAILATKTTKPGGVITYADEYIGRKVAGCFGWFQIFIYYPALIAVVSWIVGVYMCMLFNWNSTPENLTLIGIVAFVIIFGINYFSAILGGFFQNFSTISKVILLLVLAIAGFIYGDPKFVAHSGDIVGTFGWLGALAPIAFSYDGWVVSTSISHEIKNSKRNLPIALIFGPLFVLAAYIFYFVGISILLGPDEIMRLGDAHVNAAVTMIFGNAGAKVFLIFIVISVLGTLNGFTLGSLRMPYSLAIRNMFPNSKKVAYIKPGHHVPKYSSKISFVLAGIWIIINYLTQKYNLIPNSDVSEIPIVASYILYIALYICVIKMYFKGEVKSFVRGVIVPIIAILGSVLIIVGGLQNPMTIIYLVICVIVIIIAYLYLVKIDNDNLK